MSVDAVRNGYARSFIFLHWLTALMVALAFLLIEAKEYFDLEDWETAIVYVHKSAGMCVLILMLARITMKVSGGSGARQRQLSPLLERLGDITHWMIYVLMLAVPLTGWLKVSAAGKAIALFGIPVPALMVKNRDLADSFGTAHEVLAYLFLGMIALHLAAALWHGFIRKDTVLYSMLPFDRFRSH